MAGIVAYGAYLPLLRLGKGTAGWQYPNEKAVGNFDEDSLTMAVEAGRDCLSGFESDDIDGLYMASTTFPYVEKQSAAIAALALDLPSSVRAVDYTTSLRAGTLALRAAFDSVNSGASKKVLVSTADSRLALPGSGLERFSGDGAAAVLVGNEDVILEIEDVYTHTSEIVDTWRTDGEPYLMSWEERFGFEMGYLRDMEQAIATVTHRNGINIEDLHRIIMFTPNHRGHTSVARKLKIDPKTQLQDPLINTVGNTGAASVMIALAKTLETATPGERILLANYGDGCDVFLFRVTDKIGKLQPRRGVSTYLASKRVMEGYSTYLKFHSLVIEEGMRRPPEGTSAPSLWRDQNEVLRLHAGKCSHCGTVQFPIQRVCGICLTKDRYEEVPLSCLKGEIFTYTKDYLALSLAPPMVKAVVDLHDGARIFCEVTDEEPDAVEVGLKVEMTFRKVREAAGFPHYYWKSRPIRI